MGEEVERERNSMRAMRTLQVWRVGNLIIHGADR